MNHDDSEDTLAARAAAWVPPWERSPDLPQQPEPPAQPEPGAQPEPPAAGEPPAGAERVADAELPAGPELPADPEPVADAELPADPEPPADAEPEVESGAEPRPEPETAAPAGTPVVKAETHDPPPADDDQPPVELRPALEAILLVVDEPVSEVLLAEVLEQPAEQIAAELSSLAAEYTAAGRGFDLRRAAGGWRLYTRTDYAAYVERFVLDGQSVRLTQAALETLAVVAYKQPVTRSRISAIRGVNCDGVVRTLVTRGLIEECGTEPETGAHLYRTSSLFLEKLGLDSVEQLPPLAPFLPDDVDEIADAQR